MRYLIAILLLTGCDEPKPRPDTPGHIIRIYGNEWGGVIEYRDEEHRVTCYRTDQALSCLRDEEK